jgi:hypothetical protein
LIILKQIMSSSSESGLSSTPSSAMAPHISIYSETTPPVDVVHRPTIFHVTGPQGAGKSHMLDELSKLSGVREGYTRLKDIDDMLFELSTIMSVHEVDQADNPHFNYTIIYVKTLEKLYTNFIKETMETMPQCTQIVFFGLGNIVASQFTPFEYDPSTQSTSSSSSMTLPKNENVVLVEEDVTIYEPDSESDELFEKELVVEIDSIYSVHEYAPLKDEPYYRKVEIKGSDIVDLQKPDVVTAKSGERYYHHLAADLDPDLGWWINTPIHECIKNQFKRDIVEFINSEEGQAEILEKKQDLEFSPQRAEIYAVLEKTWYVGMKQYLSESYQDILQNLKQIIHKNWLKQSKEWSDGQTTTDPIDPSETVSTPPNASPSFIALSASKSKQDQKSKKKRNIPSSEKEAFYQKLKSVLGQKLAYRFHAMQASGGSRKDVEKWIEEVNKKLAQKVKVSSLTNGLIDFKTVNAAKKDHLIPLTSVHANGPWCGGPRKILFRPPGISKPKKIKKRKPENNIRRVKAKKNLKKTK